jgi:molybdate transport system substrate-binding protein
MKRASPMLHLVDVVVRVWMLASMSCWIAGCGTSRDPASTAAPAGRAEPAKPFRVAAASDLQVALPKLAERFRARTGIGVEPSFLSSGVLAQQIRQGAPFDVFLSANEAFVRDLAKDGIIRPESVHSYARGSLVLAVYRELGDRIGSLDDLAKPEVKKIALANPETAPYGKGGKQALERAGLWTRLQPKIVVAESVRQALVYAQKGDAEAALVGRAIAAVPEVRLVEIEPRLYDPIVQSLGIVADSSRQADAERFTGFVLGEEGQTILKEFGFKPATVDVSGTTSTLPSKAESRSE